MYVCWWGEGGAAVSLLVLVCCCLPSVLQWSWMRPPHPRLSLPTRLAASKVSLLLPDPVCCGCVWGRGGGCQSSGLVIFSFVVSWAPPSARRACSGAGRGRLTTEVRLPRRLAASNVSSLLVGPACWWCGCLVLLVLLSFSSRASFVRLQLAAVEPWTTLPLQPGCGCQARPSRKCSHGLSNESPCQAWSWPCFVFVGG